jgi:hypothetical protein
MIRKGERISVTADFSTETEGHRTWNDVFQAPKGRGELAIYITISSKVDLQNLRRNKNLLR